MDRYWVGGTDTWDATAGTKWAATSGGAGGETVPTASDDVFFDANSGAGVVTIGTSRVAKSINCTGFTGTLGNSSNTITVSGSVTLDAGMTYNHTGTMVFNGTGTLTTAGKTFSAVNINGSGITLTLGGALSTATAGGNSSITVTEGTFDTASYNVTTSTFNSTNSNTRTISLGSSTVTMALTGGINFANNTNLTFNAGTSQINFTFASVSLSGGASGGAGVTFYNVSFTDAGTTTLRRIIGNNTFNNLSISNDSQNSSRFIFGGDQTINGTLTLSDTSELLRGTLQSDVIGTARTLTCAAFSGDYYNFRDITIAGAAAPIAPTAAGDCGNNSGITFPSPKTVYRVGSGIQWNDSNAWATSSGGSGADANFPLPQDTAIIDDNCSPTAALRIAVSMDTGTVDMSSRTTAISVYNEQSRFYGNYTVSSAVTVTGTTLIFHGAGTQTLTTAGQSFAAGITVEKQPTTSLVLADALTTATTRVINVLSGNFDTASYNVSCGSFSTGGNLTRSLILGSSTLTLDTNFSCSGSNVSISSGTSQITLNGSTSTFIGNSLTYYNVSYGSTSAGIRIINGENIFNNLVLNASASGLSQLRVDGNQTVNGTLTCAGTSSTQRAFLFSNTVGTARTITANSVSADDCDFRDITIAGVAAPITPTRAGNCGNNSGITFPASKNVYRVGTETTWVGSSSWALSSGGSGSDNNFPLAQDVAIIDENTALTGTLDLTTLYNISGLDASGRTTGITLNHNVLTPRYGSYILGSGVTVSGTSTQQFFGTSTKTIVCSGKTLTFSIVVGEGTVELGDALLTSNTLSLTRGTFNANNYNVSVTTFASSGSVTRTLTMGSGLWSLTGTGTVWNMGTVVTGITFNKDSANILLTNETTSNRSFNGGGLTYNKLTIGGPTGTSVLTISGENTFAELDSTKTVSHTIRIGVVNNGLTINNFSVTGTSGNLVTFDSSVAGTRRLINITSINRNTDYMRVQDIEITQANKFYVGVNSIDDGNNVNVNFTVAPLFTATGNFFMLFI